MIPKILYRRKMITMSVFIVMLFVFTFINSNICAQTWNYGSTNYWQNYTNVLKMDPQPSPGALIYTGNPIGMNPQPSPGALIYTGNPIGMNPQPSPGALIYTGNPIGMNPQPSPMPVPIWINDLVGEANPQPSPYPVPFSLGLVGEVNPQPSPQNMIYTMNLVGMNPQPSPQNMVLLANPVGMNFSSSIQSMYLGMGGMLNGLMGASMYQEFIGGDEPWENRFNQFMLGTSFLFPGATYVSNDNTSQMTSRQYNILSNTLNARHDTAKAIINNVR